MQKHNSKNSLPKHWKVGVVIISLLIVAGSYWTASSQGFAFENLSPWIAVPLFVALLCPELVLVAVGFCLWCVERLRGAKSTLPQ